MQNKKMEIRAAMEEEARERRHNELVATNASNASALLAISVESARVTMMSTVSSEKVAERLATLNRILATRPCILTCHSLLRRIIEEGRFVVPGGGEEIED
jgi:hypothetical protein